MEAELSPWSFFSAERKTFPGPVALPPGGSPWESRNPGKSWGLGRKILGRPKRRIPQPVFPPGLEHEGKPAFFGPGQGPPEKKRMSGPPGRFWGRACALFKPLARKGKTGKPLGP